MLELIVKAEDQMATWLDSTPWYVKTLFYPEYRQAERALHTMKHLRENPRTKDWFTEYALATNLFYDAAHDAVNSGLTFYEQLSAVPHIGPQVQRTVQTSFDNMIGSKLAPRMGSKAVRTQPYVIPPAAAVTPIVESMRTVSLTALASTASQELEGSVESYVRAFSRPYTPSQDGYWLRSAVLDLAQAIGGVVDIIMGEPSTQYTRYQG